MNVKTRLTAILMLILLALSMVGCQDSEQVVATVGSEKIYKWQVLLFFNENKAAIKGTQGVDLDDPKNYLDKRKALENYLDTIVNNKILYLKALEQGYALTADEQAQVQKKIDDMVERNISFNAEQYFSGQTDARKKGEEMYIKYLKDNMLSVERLLAMESEKAVAEKLAIELQKEVTVPEEQIRAAFDSTVEQQKVAYEKDPTKYAKDMEDSDLIAFYAPYDAVRVRYILVGFDDETKEKIRIERKKQNIKESQGGFGGMEGIFEQEQAIQELTKTGLENSKAKADEVYQKLEGGLNFNDAIVTYNSDPAMSEVKGRVRGVIVYKESSLIPAEIASAAMELKEVNDFSKPVKTSDGWIIMQLMEKLPKGEKNYETIRKVIINQMTYQDKMTIVNGYASEHEKEFNIKRYYDRLR